MQAKCIPLFLLFLVVVLFLLFLIHFYRQERSLPVRRLATVHIEAWNAY
jgi:hypothetical protein